MNNLLKTDDRYKNVPINNYYALMFDYLTTAMSEFKICKKLKKYREFTQQEFIFVGNDEDNVLDVDISYNEHIKIYVGIRKTGSLENYKEIKNYRFDDFENQIILDFIPSKDDEIYISFYEIGSFDEDLTLEEKRILADLVLLIYDESKIQNETLLTQRVYGISTKMHSQASHIEALIKVKESLETKVRRNIMDYSYSADLSSLAGNVGGR